MHLSSVIVTLIPKRRKELIYSDECIFSIEMEPTDIEVLLFIIIIIFSHLSGTRNFKNRICQKTNSNDLKNS